MKNWLFEIDVFSQKIVPVLNFLNLLFFCLHQFVSSSLPVFFSFLSEGRAITVFQSTFSLKIDFKWTWSQWWTCRWRCRRPSWPDVTLQLSSGYDTSNRFLVLFSLDPVLQIHGLISKSIFGPYLTTLICSIFRKIKKQWFCKFSILKSLNLKK